ncbi:MAG: hypothetical protein KJ077_03010 [Anaerolineae bacterium]|nr:hypothetical protein [Anaerolineae bacterium]
MNLLTHTSSNFLLETKKSYLSHKVLITGYISAWIVIVFLALNETMWHWFVIPTFICGVLVGADAITWLRGEFDLFDPKGVIGASGWYFFFLAPLLFVHWDIGIRYVINPPDWRPWVGYWSILNIAALLLYLQSQKVGFRFPIKLKPTIWTIEFAHATPWILAFIGLALVNLVYYFYQVGGIAGLVSTTMVRRQAEMRSTTGLGVFEIIGSSLPLICLILITLQRYRHGTSRSRLIIISFLVLILSISQLLIGGLKGSRSTTIWLLVWMVGIIHYFWRPFTRWNVFVGLLILISFMYLYGFYKGNTQIGGMEAINMLADGVPLSELEMVTGRQFRAMLIGDLARVDTQSYQLFRFISEGDYDLRWGKTYYMSVLSFIPSWLWPDRPPEPAKVAAGTELFLGRGSYVPGNKFLNSQRVYGLGGEAMLNFGILSFPLPFIIWGFLIGCYRQINSTWQEKDARWFIAPFITLLFLISLFSDLDNILGFIIANGLFPLLLLWLIFKRTGNKVTT